MKILYFTATGNNLYIAKRMGGELLSIPKMIKENRYEFEDDKIGIIFPVFHGGVPRLVENFLNNTNLKSEYIFAIASYGSIAGGTAKHLLQIGKKNEIKFSYVNEILMIDNWLPVFDMDKERRKEPKKKIEEKLNKIIEDIQENKVYIKKHSAIINGLQVINAKKNDVPFEKKFLVKNNCTGCKICDKVCPVNNIKVEKKPYFKCNCQQCLACIHNCPQQAIYLKSEKSGARFRNQNITLKEIINSNI